MIRSLLAVAIGGGIGSALRYAVSRIVQANAPGGTFPWATLTVNVAGCLLIGLFYGLAARGSLGGDTMKLMLATGLCGGFTTFSTFSNEGLMLMRGDNALMALLYVAASVVAGLAAVAGGYAIATALGHSCTRI